MKWAAISLALCVTAASTGCWRPYYGHTYAPPAYQQAPVYQQPPVYQQQPVYQQAPVMQQPQVIQQGCPQVVCPPNPCCTSY
jgi:hypothetical protein